MKKLALIAALPLSLALAACGGAEEDTAADDTAMTDEGAMPETAPADPMADMTVDEQAEVLDESAESLEERADRVEDVNEAEADRLEAEAEAQQDTRDAID